eukprot:PhF_6_TR33511/c0_g1_i2/m.48849
MEDTYEQAEVRCACDLPNNASLPQEFATLFFDELNRCKSTSQAMKERSANLQRTTLPNLTSCSEAKAKELVKLKEDVASANQESECVRSEGLAAVNAECLGENQAQVSVLELQRQLERLEKDVRIKKIELQKVMA